MSNGPSAGLWGAAEAYEGYMGRWSRRVAPLFTEWLAPTPHRDWVDLGCGTGVLSAQVSRTCQPRSLLGLDTSEGFLRYAAAHVPGATFRVGDAADTRLPSGAFDAAVSGLVLNFVPDPALALREMARIVRPGGQVALYVWDYAGHMQIMRAFFDAARPIDPGSVVFDDGVNAPICRPGPLREALGAAGLADVEVTALDIPAAFDHFGAYWAPFLGGTGSAPKYCASLAPDVRERVKEAVRAALPTGPDGEILLAVRAWAARGTVPA